MKRPPLRALYHMLLSLIATSARRVIGRSIRRTWPFGYEVVVGALRRNARWTARRPLEEARAFQERLALLTPDIPGVRLEGRTVGGVPVVVHELLGSSATTLLYLHGGAHVAGSPSTHAELASRLALAGKLDTIVVDFRLAPEHSVHDAVNDVLAVHSAQVAEGKRVVWAGDSSGGALVFLALIAARERGMQMPERVAAVSPWPDLRCISDSYVRYRGVDWSTAEALRSMALLAARGAALDDPSLSPLFADLRGLPPSMILAGGAELVLDDARALFEALTRAGNDADFESWPDQVHAFPLLAAYHPEAARALEELGAFLAHSELRTDDGA